MLALETIKSLGVDMAITKQDLIDIIAQDLKDAADTEQEEARAAYKHANEAWNDFQKALTKAHIDEIANSEEVTKIQAFFQEKGVELKLAPYVEHVRGGLRQAYLFDSKSAEYALEWYGPKRGRGFHLIVRVPSCSNRYDPYLV